MSKPGARIGGFELVTIVVLLALGAGLRFWRLDLGWFGVDQARDIQTALDIAAGHDWPTVGPTMRRVTSLGALYYYFWALPHLLSDEPLAAYQFAAGLGVVTLLLAWGFARRFWGSLAALVTLATLATSPVAVIDGRVAWAPAALPVVAVLLLWLLAGTLTTWRLGVLGAVLGLAIQLHLTMVAWGVAAFVLVVGRRPGWRACAAAVLGSAVTGFPAVYAALTNAGQDAGIATLPSRGPFPDVLGRLTAALALAWRVPAAFWHWNDAPEAWPLVARIAAGLIAAVGVLGVARLGMQAIRRDRVATIVVTVMTCQLGMVALLPGDAWYYYLDAAVPLWALAAGACCMPPIVGGRRAFSGPAVIVIAAALLLGVHGAQWLGESARHGYLMVNPVALTLDGAGGRDAADPGRLVAAGVKRAVATAVATESVSFSTRWLATHGPGLDEATGDNGFWLHHAIQADGAAMGAGAAPVRHAAIWYREHPDAPIAPAPGFELVDVGPFVVVRYPPSILYASCRDHQGPVTVPIRVIPHPRRYGDGTVARPASLPARITCAVAPGSGSTHVVAAVTAGSVTLRDGGGARGPTGVVSTLCITRSDHAIPFTIDIALPGGVASDFDLYERPGPSCVGNTTS